MKTFCLSDLHIGYERANYPKIEEVLELVRRDADKLVLVGDILDLWLLPIELISGLAPFKDALEDLIRTANEVDTTYITGNHDLQVKDLVKSLPMPVVNNLTLDNIYFTHGWQFDTQQGFLRIFQGIPEVYYYIVQLVPHIYQRYYKTPSMIPREEYAFTEKARELHGIAQIFAERKKFDYLVMGHTHDPIVEGKVVDCGDFIDSISYIVIEDGEPELKRLRRQ